MKNISSIKKLISTKISYCDYCNSKLDSAIAHIHKVIPKKGDCSVCGFCGGFLIFSDTLIQKRLTLNDFNKLEFNEKIVLTTLYSTAKIKNKNDKFEIGKYLSAIYERQY
jgi:hypothetical protein